MSSPGNPLSDLPRVVRALAGRADDVVFLGGSVLGLLLEGAAVGALRVTNDLDCFLRVSSRADYARFESHLRDAGFVADKDGPVCRYKLGTTIVDFMPTDPTILGFANRWANEAVQRAETRSVGGVAVRVVTVPYFLATKLEAFLGRAEDDFAASPDLEDIITVVDARNDVVDLVEATGSLALKQWLGETLTPRLERLSSHIAFHLPGDRASQARAALVDERIRALAAL